MKYIPTYFIFWMITVILIPFVINVNREAIAQKEYDYDNRHNLTAFLWIIFAIPYLGSALMIVLLFSNLRDYFKS